MKKSWKIVLIILLLICSASFAFYLLTKKEADTKPPELSIPSESLLVQLPLQESALLEEIRATDDVDGDVTDLVVLESVSDLFDGNHATATYAAFDHSGNVSKGQRTIIYSNYRSPHFSLQYPLIFKQGASFDIFDPIGAEDMLDGNLDHRIKGSLISGESAIQEPGTYEVEYRVTNSLGDTVHLRVPVEILAEGAHARIGLTSYLTYLKKGSTMDPDSFLEADSREFVGRIDNQVRSDVPGVYTVTYYDIRDDVYQKTRLLVVVEDA